ncbi:MAG: hypothetical protein Q9166_004243 [cf. Caloplaca sp. 2 TL-2023]
MIRFVPRWMRSSPFGSAEPSSNANYDVEALRVAAARGSDGTAASGNAGALALLGRRWHRGWLEATRWSASSDTYVDHMGPDMERQTIRSFRADLDVPNDSRTTVRMRRANRQSESGCTIDSEDVERATSTQLLGPTGVASLLQLFRRPSVQTTSPTPSMVTSRCSRIEPSQTSAVKLPPPHQLSGNQYNTGCYLTFGDRHHLPNLPSNNHPVTHHHSLPKRISTWTYGFDGSHPRSATASLLSTNDNFQPQSAPASLLDLDTESLNQAPDPPSEIIVPRKRRGTKSTDTSTAEAERMSIIDVPFQGTRRISDVDARDEPSFDAKEYERAAEDDGCEDILVSDGFSSVSSSRVGSLLMR